MNPAITDQLNSAISRLTAVSDFVKRINNDSFLLEEETPLGLHLVMGDCIEELRKISEQI
jgi:hypothetical protein